jgi:ribonuclease HII
MQPPTEHLWIGSVGPVPPARLRTRPPGLEEERKHWDAGRSVVVGIDEVGRGSWAGPLTVGAVVVPHDRRVYRIRDSKQLSAARREAMFDRICDWATAWGVGHASAAECDELGMSEAQRLAARRALDALGVEPDAALVDGKWNFVGRPNTTMLVKGDARSLSIAAASILAKVTRDRIMRAEAESFPAYAFDQNKGYPCPRHKLALKGYGPSSIHRRSWVFMERLAWRGVVRTQPVDTQGELF